MIIKALDVPYKSQYDNVYEPYAACNVTSLAMCLEYWNVGQSEHMQLEDVLFQEAIDHGWNRFSPSGLKALAESYEGIYDHLTQQGTLQDIRDSIDKGWPVIVHGFFSPPGHIIVINGYTESGFVVQDPGGEMEGVNYLNSSKSGKNLHYSNSLIAAACDSWCFAQAKQRYPMSKVEAKRCNSLWIHRIERSDDHLIK